MAAVKSAAPSEFPELLAEWERVFAESDPGMEGRAENALLWLLAMWLVQDPEGFLTAIKKPGFNYAYSGAQVAARMMPGEAMELLAGRAGENLDEFFLNELAKELAASHPSLYLKLNPDGGTDFASYRSDYDDWERAVSNLAKTDPMAAANACLRWNRENNATNTIHRALLGVAQAWRTGDPPIAEWINAIEDLQLRNLAHHARLSALAEVNPHEALQELYAAGLEENNDLGEDAPREILKQLARADLVEALKLMKEVEGIFAKSTSGPFEQPVFEGEGERAALPFSGLSSGRYAGRDEVENNGVRHAVLETAVYELPDDPGELIGALRNLSAKMNSIDPTWQRGVEGDLIRLKSENWSVEDCLAATKLWAEELDGSRDDRTFQKLAERAVHVHPEEVSAALHGLPFPARSPFASELLKSLPNGLGTLPFILVGALTEAQWDEELGRALGRNPEAYAQQLLYYPAATTRGAWKTFMEGWGNRDPETAAQWLSIPNVAAEPGAAGLTAAWASYDEPAASAWAKTLPAGPARDGAAVSLSDALVRVQSEEAWEWAASISDASSRAKSLHHVGYHWKSKVPAKYRAAHNNARRELGFSVEEDELP